MNNDKEDNKMHNQEFKASKSKYVDDMTMFMSWQNYCLTQYSWTMFQMANYQNMMNFQNAQYYNHLLSTQNQQQNTNNNNHQNITHQNTIGLQAQTRKVFKLASLQKRILAEVIDFLLLAFAKALIILYFYGNEYLEHFEFVMVINEKVSITDIEWMFGQALVYRIFVIAYEAYCLSGTLPFSKGQTIGKTIVGIKTLHASTAGDIEVFNLEQRLVRLVPRPLGVIRSCSRSLIKNVATALLFPLLLPALVFKHNKLVYDLVVDSIVVEKTEYPQ